ncbi:MAG: hypothetical protein NTV80_16575 [Verrucomicrobia bacterium]|nr:hypothetical protein [Verrucomicrobiota bacterium]
MSHAFKAIIILIGLSLIYLQWRGLLTGSAVRSATQRQTIDQVLFNAAGTTQILLADGQIKKEDLPAVIESAKKGDPNSAMRLRTHYRFSGQREEFKKWQYFGMTPDESWSELEDSIQELPVTQKLLEALNEGFIK